MTDQKENAPVAAEAQENLANQIFATSGDVEMDYSTQITEAENAPLFCSGFGKHHSPNNERDPRPLLGISMDEIRTKLKNPQAVDKSKAQWAIFSTLRSRSHAEQRQRGEYHALWADIDDTGGLTLVDTFSRAVGALLCDVLAYASRSATKDNQKCRLIVPLAEPVSGARFVAMAKILNARLRDAGLVPDTVTERTGQPCYLPNRGEFYAFEVEDVIGPLSPDDWAQEIAEQEAAAKAEQAAREAARAAAKVKAQQRMASGEKSPIDAFNAAYDVGLMLDTFGYLKKGDRWLGPNSSSRSPGVSLTDDGRKWLSTHGSDSGIGRTTDNGTMGDAFDLFVYYQHGGDKNAAIKAAGEMFTTPEGLSITKANQLEYMQAQALEQAAADFDALLTPGQTFSLDQFALNGQAATMEAAMLDDVFILGRMAILGQSTVFYAKPNAGKTLLTIWLIVEAIKKGTMQGEDIFYINADDNHKGLTFKLKLAEKHGFRMLAPGYNGFKAEMLAQVLEAMIQAEGARGKVLILDTVKKFTDIMRKDKATKFGEAVRQFVAHGGSVIMLAHVNKHRDEEGKVIFSGTSDLVDDVDCAYTLDTVTEDKFSGTRTVKFENFKSRGDVESEALYEYDFSSGTSYQARLDSVRSVSDSEREEAEKRQRLDLQYEQNREAIEAIREAIREGVTHKTDLIKDAMERSGVSRKRIIKALADHTGTNSLERQYWTVNKEDKNAHVYKLNWPG